MQHEACIGQLYDSGACCCSPLQESVPQDSVAQTVRRSTLDSGYQLLLCGFFVNQPVAFGACSCWGAVPAGQSGTLAATIYLSTQLVLGHSFISVESLH
jgi:hypothetical protein